MKHPNSYMYCITELLFTQLMFLVWNSAFDGFVCMSGSHMFEFTAIQFSRHDAEQTLHKQNQIRLSSCLLCSIWSWGHMVSSCRQKRLWSDWVGGWAMPGHILVLHVFWFYNTRAFITSPCTVVPTKSDSDVILCLQSLTLTRTEGSLVY